MNRMCRIYNKVAMMLISALYMVSCTLDKPEPFDRQESMSFQPVVNMARTSKTIIQGTEYPTAESFYVSAYYYANNDDRQPQKIYINKNEVTGNGTTWGTATDYYWPLSGYMGFVAYSPSTVNAEITNDGVKIQDFGYVIDTPEKTRVDFMYFKANEKISCAGHPSTVDVTFKHALTQVAFYVKPQAYYTTTASDGTTNQVTITIDKILLRNIYYKGSFTQNDENPQSQWDVYDEEDKKIYQDECLINYTLLNSDAGHGTVLQYDGTTPKSVPVKLDQNTDLAALLIPQTLNENAALDVTYSVTQTTTNEDDTIVAPYTITFSNSIQIHGNPKQVLEMGKKLVYNICIGLDAISLEATYGEWSGNGNGNGETVEPQ